MKKRRGFYGLISLCSTLLLGVLFSFAKPIYQEAKATNLDANIFDVQVRSGGGELNYIVIRDTRIDPDNGTMANSDYATYNALSHIKIYMSQSDGGILLSSIVDNRAWAINLWQCGGVMFPLSSTTYETYNGQTIYAIEVLQGCTYPNQDLDVIEVKETVKYGNQNYGDPAHKTESFEWGEMTVFVPSEDAVTLVGAQLRADVDGGLYYLCLRSDSFTTITKEYPELDIFNCYSKIKIYADENDTGTTLGEITTLRKGCQNKWNSGAVHFSLSAEEFELHNGTNTYQITVEAGCQLPLGNKIVTVSKDYTFVNQDYGNADCKYGAFYFLPDVAPVTKPIALTGAQVRADDKHHFYFIDLLANEFKGVAELHTLDFGGINAYTHIKIYLNAQDEGILLGDVTTQRIGAQNLWNSGAVLFGLTVDEYEIYNGTTIYAIEVLEGCEVLLNDQIIAIDKAYSFVNNDYGKPAAKYQAFNFSMDTVSLENLGTIEITTIHNRMDHSSGYRWIMFFMEDNIYEQNMLVNSWVDETNLLDNVTIYLEKDGEPFTLREIYDPTTSGVTLALFGQKNMIGVSISNAREGDHYLYDGPHMYMVSIAEGTQIPTFENGVAGYRVVTDKIVFVNDEYQMFGDIPGQIVDGRARQYEEWNINWSTVDCLITFKVVGIEGLYYKDISLKQGERISLRNYEQEGYDLVATTTKNETVHKYIIGASRNIDIILTYTLHNYEEEEERPKKGCKSSIIASSALISIASLLGTSLLINKKKGYKNEK